MAPNTKFLTVPQVENLTFVVNRAPQPELPPRDHCGHLIARCRPRASAAKFSRERRSEFQYPSPHRFVGDIQSALCKQIFDVAIAERETHIEPNGMPDDRRRKPMASKRDRHAPSYPQTDPRHRPRDKAPISVAADTTARFRNGIGLGKFHLTY
jgi:hypothetical protein